MNDSIHASDSIAVLTHDKIHMEQLCYLSLHCQYSKHMPACPRGLALTPFQNNAKRLGIAFPDLILIQIEKRILDIQAN
jgi:hypothetical protein